MVAPFETEGGAALIAFWIFHALLLAAGVCAPTPAAMISRAQPLSDERILACLMGGIFEPPSQKTVKSAGTERRGSPSLDRDHGNVVEDRAPKREADRVADADRVAQRQRGRAEGAAAGMRRARRRGLPTAA